MVYFDIWPSADGQMRLKDWSAATKSGLTTITIRIDVPDPSDAGFFMKKLADAEGEQRRPLPKSRRLPAPE